MTAKLKRDSILSDYRIALERYSQQLLCELAEDVKTLTEEKLDDVINGMPNVYRHTDNPGRIVQFIEKRIFWIRNTRTAADIEMIARTVDDEPVDN